MGRGPDADAINWAARGLVSVSRIAKDSNIAYETILRHVADGTLYAEYVQRGRRRRITLVRKEEVRTLKSALNNNLLPTHKVSRSPHVQISTGGLANGCIFHNDCFTCPFPDCVIDNPRWRINPMLVDLYKEVHTMRLTHDRAATAYILGLSLISVDKYERIGGYLEQCTV